MIRWFPVLLLGIGVSACGGGGPAGPTPLRHTLDDMHVAVVPVAEKPAVFQAQNEYNVAQAEQAQAQASLEEIEQDLLKAKNELEAARLVEKNADISKQGADKSGDLTRVNDAERELHNAQLGRRAVDAKIEWLNAQKEWLKKQVRFTAFNVYAKEARWHNEKAKVARQRNIRPKGAATPEEYEAQARERSEQAQKARFEADQERVRAEEKRKAFLAAEAERDKARGLKPAPDALGGAPAPAQPDK